MTQVLCDAFGGFVWVSWQENITGQGRVWHTVALWVQSLLRCIVHPDFAFAKTRRSLL